jgi:hypothetical protein
MERTVKARDSRNRPVISMSVQAAGLLVNHGCAVWDGRKRENIRFTVPKEAILAFVRMMRFKVPAEARGLDSKTHGFTAPRNYHHVRNETYYGGVHRLVPAPGATAEQVAELMR